MDKSKLELLERKNGKDLLSDKIESLLNSFNERQFYFLLSQIQRGEKGKSYENRDGILENGRYEEFEVNGSKDARRIIVDMDSLDIFATRDHYKTLKYAGRPLFIK